MTGRPGRAIHTIDTWYKQFNTAEWSDQSPCRERHDLPWVEDTRPTPEQHHEMASLCQQCPVLHRCADYAYNSNNGAGVDGGFYAGVWLPWRTVAPPSAETRATRDRARLFLRRLLRQFGG